MKSCIDKAWLGIVLAMLTVFSGACLVQPQSEGNQLPVISSLEADYINVYPLGTSGIRCVASDPEGDAVQLRWSCDGGSLMGDGSAVTWEAPSDYGDYHIMVIAKDNNGGSTKAVLTIAVVPRPYKGCCGRK